MADFNSLVADVFTITNRRDLVEETQLAVRAATLQVHKADFFLKDLTELTIQFTSASYLQQIPYRTLFPRYRALSYLRKYNPNYIQAQNTINLQALYYENGVGKEFEIISPDQIFDSYAAQRVDVCYLAGEMINVKSSTADSYAIMGVYQSPEVSTATKYSSWIADESPFAIIHTAASIVFGQVLSNQSKAAASAQLAAIELQAVKNSNVVTKGY